MTTNELQQIYFEILDQQKFVESELDYSIFEKHKHVLQTLSNVSNSGISVFDCYRKDHIFYSPNFCSMLGYDVDEIISKGHQFLDKKIHPDDYPVLMGNGISLIKLFYQFSIDEKTNYKLINEFRILNSENVYKRVIEQHQVLELDASNNLWLTLSIIDLSPNQENYKGVNSQLLNFRTGKTLPFLEKDSTLLVDLTKREKEILSMVKKGFLSKEISDKLSISIHTVNTHRQRVLKKLDVNSSIEAVILASKLGLLD